MAFMGDLGDIIDKAEAERFVGREHEIESFRQHISSCAGYLAHLFEKPIVSANRCAK